jgi:hypothetical protein
MLSCDEFSDDPREEPKSITDEGTSPTVEITFESALCPDDRSH